VVAVVLALAVPASASAHARLVGTVPKAGADLQRQPRSVVFLFSEPIEASFAVIRVFDAQGTAVETGKPFRAPGRSNGLEIALQPNLPEGTYSATYRLISADSYPVSGGIVFSIGKPSSGVIAPLPGQAKTGRATSVALWADRWLGYAAIGIAIGALFFLVWAWRPALAEGAAGGEEPWAHASVAFGRRLRLLIGGAIAAGVVASLLALPLQGALAAGTSPWKGLEVDVLKDVLHTRFGPLMIARAAAWAVLGAILVLAARRRRGAAPGRPVSPELVALVMLPIGSLLVSPPLAGHARTQSPQALLFPADVLHVTAMSLWLGGLATLAVAVPAALRLLDEPDRGRLLLAALSRFSAVALVSVAALALSGVAQAIFEVGSIPALVDTGYGRAVLAKSLLLGALIGLGAANRTRLIPGLIRAAEAAAGPERIWASVRRNVGIEVALIAVVLGVTALLVSYAPPSDASSSAAPPPRGRVSGRATIGDAILRYTVDPARVGLNQLNLFLRRADGRPYMRTKQIRAELLSLPDQGNIPRTVRFELVGPGHYVNSATRFDHAGLWSVKVVATGTSRSGSDVAEIVVAIG
jgi:copper transport protein